MESNTIETGPFTIQVTKLEDSKIHIWKIFDRFVTTQDGKTLVLLKQGYEYSPNVAVKAAMNAIQSL